MKKSLCDWAKTKQAYTTAFIKRFEPDDLPFANVLRTIEGDELMDLFRHVDCLEYCRKILKLVGKLEYKRVVNILISNFSKRGT